MTVIIGSKALKQVESESPILARAIGQLVPRKVVYAYGNIDVLVDVEGLRETLSKDIHDVIIGVASVIEFRAKRRLPFLSLQHSSSVGGMVDERLEIEFADAAELGAWFEINIRPALVHIRSIHEADFWIEVGSNLVAPRHEL